MSQSRLKLIKQAFDKLDKNGNGEVTVDDLKGVYSVKHHPKYTNGEKNEDQLLGEFLAKFDTEVKDGKVINSVPYLHMQHL